MSGKRPSIFTSESFLKNKTKARSSFTLIELLIVIAILVILAVVVILTLNPSELLAQSRDSGRLSDMASLNSAINIYLVDSAGVGSLGTANTVYVSLPDSSSSCGDLGLPTLPSGYTYNCVTSTSTHNTNGTGWLPVKLASTSSGTPLGSLPKDPTNATSSGLYYTYVTDGNGNYEVTMVPESIKYGLGGSNDTASNDGGILPDTYETGNKLSLNTIDRGVNVAGEWIMDEGSGIVAYDSSRHQNNGTTTNGTWLSSGCLNSGSCLSFNGSNTYITTSVLNNSGIIGDNNFTMSGWIKPISWVANDVALAIWSGSGNLKSVNFGVPNGNCFINYYSDNHTYTCNIQTGTWYLITYVQNNGVGYTYVNGQLMGSNSAILAFGSTPNIVIGNYGNFNGGAFSGLISNVHVYNTALSASQIQAIYNAKQ